MRTLSLVVLAASMLLGCATLPASPGFGGLEGGWRGAGQFQGAPSRVEARFAPILGGRVWALDIEIVATPPDAAPIRFAGRAQYVMQEGAPIGGVWMDSRGAAYDLAPRWEGDALIVEWGDGAIRGRSEYRLQADGDLQIDDFALAAGGASRQFATAELRRAR